MKPIKILIQGQKLQIRWDDQSISIIPLYNLRKECPCATCGAEREEQSSSYIPVYNQEQLQVKKIKPLGHYAISITWQDGHSTGVYEYNYLIQLSKMKEDL